MDPTSTDVEFNYDVGNLAPPSAVSAFEASQTLIDVKVYRISSTGVLPWAGQTNMYKISVLMSLVEDAVGGWYNGLTSRCAFTYPPASVSRYVGLTSAEIIGVALGYAGIAVLPILACAELILDIRRRRARGDEDAHDFARKKDWGVVTTLGGGGA